MRPLLPDGLWPLAHELTIIIVRGGPKDAESQGAATLAMPDQDDTDLLTEYARELLDQLQDQLTSLIHTGR